MNKSKLSKLKGNLRMIGSEEGLSGIQRDFFAEFMTKRFPKSIENKVKGRHSYLNEWARRFGDGTEFHHADEESEALLLKIMLDGMEGTARHIQSEKVRDAIDTKKLEELI